MKLEYVYTEDFLAWQLREDHPINPIRSLVTKHLLEDHGFLADETWNDGSLVQRAQWETDARKVSNLDEIPEELFDTVLTMFGGTHHLVERLIADRVLEGTPGVYLNPAGGETPGHENVSVLNDTAWAVHRLVEAGLKVGFVSLDPHLDAAWEEPLVNTETPYARLSQHLGVGAGPGGVNHSAEQFTLALGPGAGDYALVAWIEDLVHTWETLDLEALVLVPGADGLVEDSSSHMDWTLEGLATAALILATYTHKRQTSVLILGGGGNQPLDSTPQAWVNFALALATEMEKHTWPLTDWTF